MKKKLFVCGVLYYPLSLLLYAGFFYLTAYLFRLSGEADNLGAAIALTYGVLLIGTPIAAAILARFSLLRWYVDPIAAAQIPLFLYIGMLVGQLRHTPALRSAILLLNAELSDDGGMGWLFLGALFLFGLAASFSLSRKKGESIGYRVLGKIFS